MVQRVGGFRRKTRYKLSKDIRSKGKISLTNYFQKFNENDKVKLLANPSVQKGMYFPRFHGKFGLIKEKRGSSYIVQIKDGNKQKSLVVHPIHLKKV